MALFAIGLLVAALTPCLAFAVDSPVTSSAPSGGTLAAVLLESWGYFGQEAIIRDLKGFIQNYAILIWVTVAILAIIEILFFQSYDKAMWLVIGPVFYSFLLKTTGPGAFVEWRFGGNALSQQEVEAAKKDVGLDGTYEVSWAFQKYNDLVSRVYQEAIRVLTSSQSLEVMTKFMTRESIMTDLLSMRSPKGEFEVFSIETLNTCSEELNAARIIATGKRDEAYRATPEYLLAQSKYKNFSNRIHKVESSGSVVYLRGLLGRIDTLASATGGGETTKIKVNEGIRKHYGTCISNTQSRISKAGSVDALLQSGTTDQGKFSCEEFWCFMGIGLYDIVAKKMVEAEAQRGLTDAPQDLYQKMWTDIGMKLAPPSDDLSSWVNDVSGQPQPASGLTSDDYISLIPVIVGGYLLREAVQRDDAHTKMMAQFADHVGYEAPSYNFDVKLDEKQVRDLATRSMQHQIAESKKYEIYMFSMTLPYVQGIILFALCISFPFFSLLMLIPGKASALVVWLKAWAWVKLWDVGWALVMLIEEFLWGLMPHSSVFDPLKDPNHGPISVFEQTFQGDPAYSLATYYVIVGTLISAVPMFSAQVILGANAAIFTPLMKGMQQFAQKVGGQAGIMTAVEQQQQTDMLREMGVFKEASAMVSDWSEKQKSGQYIDKYAANLGSLSKDLRRMAAEAEKGGDGKTTLAMALGLATGGSGGMLDKPLTNREAAGMLKRMANEVDSEGRRYMASVAYFKAGMSPEFTGLDYLRAAQSNRGEFSQIPEAPTKSYANLIKEYAGVDVGEQQVEAGRTGNLGASNLSQSNFNQKK